MYRLRTYPNGKCLTQCEDRQENSRQAQKILEPGKFIEKFLFRNHEERRRRN